MPLFLGRASSLSPDLVTTGLYDLGMLAWGLTQLTLVATTFSELVGYANRVGVLHETLVAIGMSIV